MTTIPAGCARPRPACTRLARTLRLLPGLLAACLVAAPLAACGPDPAPPVGTATATTTPTTTPTTDAGDGVRYGGGAEGVLPPALADVVAPAAADDRGGIPVSSAGVGVAGEGDVVVDVYADPACPWCARFDAQHAEALLVLVADGGVTLVHRPLAFLDDRFGGTYSTRAVHALAVVADGSPEHYVDVLHALMAHQPDPDDTEALTDLEIADLARAAGVPEAVVERFTAVAETPFEVATADGGTERRTATSRVLAPWVAAATHRAALDLGAVRVPTILVDGVPVEDWDETGRLADAIAAARA
ncbi:DsbA family protein [Cellulomonas pakistanensis]|uniref:Thioredoxin-like fold domain-containing protein n=1 Tax=Cellulomonas pakistanensis TaxID=992287 RepID=A0A919U757_9CELL|nr:thioredoxin domain-containing protein [Cellulomonas pakistanensis]GIG36970.1 hypothetical protein Cpa01nite_23510 [Cellulomonas pakistanensis]